MNSFQDNNNGRGLDFFIRDIGPSTRDRLSILPFTLKMYNALVLGVSEFHIWKCPTHRQLAHYNSHVSDNRLDVGVSTGFYLEHCRFPSHRPRLALLDMNASALRHGGADCSLSSRRSIRLMSSNPTCTEGMAPFDSVCCELSSALLAGTLAVKGKVFKNIRSALNPGERILWGHHSTGGCAPKLWPAV